MRVLLTCVSLAERAGTELWVRDFARALAGRGHDVGVYTKHAGPPAEELRAAGIPVVRHLADTGPAPDLVHGQHPQAIAALGHHRTSPALFVSHSSHWWMDAPPLHPRIHRYAAVDEPTRARLVARGVAFAHTRVIPNAVDLDRFRPRDPLPSTPRRALVFSNYASEETYLPAVRDACARAGLSLDVAGAQSGRPVGRPEEILAGYDLVFAKARCALEALATGCAVVLCDGWGAGPLVKAADVDRMRPLNFGRKLLTRPVTAGTLLAEIARYDATDAGEASRRVRAVAGLDAMVDAYLRLYEEVVAEHARTPLRLWEERRALAAYLVRVPPLGAFRMTAAHERLRAWALRGPRLAALVRARRRLFRRLGVPGYGGATAAPPRDAPASPTARESSSAAPGSPS